MTLSKLENSAPTAYNKGGVYKLVYTKREMNLIRQKTQRLLL